MKKQNNILEVIKNIIYLTFVCAFLNACTDQEIYKPSTVKEGIPVKINFGISTPGMDKVTTRSLTEEGESQVNDLYLLVFNKDGNNLKTRKFYSTNEISSSLGNKSKGTLVLETTSGESRIYAIANVETTELNGTSIREELDNVSSVNDLFNVTASLKDSNIERVQASLTMSGTFEQKGFSESLQKQGYCTIPETNSTLDGKIYLSRLDSHITFKISTASNVEFTPTSWQVKYIPLKSTVIAQNKSLIETTNDYADSKTYTGFGTNEEGGIQYRTFDFYMLESIKKAITADDGTKIASDEEVSKMTDENKQIEYAKREKEIKTPEDNDGKVKNTGIYKYSEPYATFVEIKGSLEIKLDNGRTRIATVTYVIHLGGGTTNPSNFTSERNTKYTYLMKINDVENIIVEVKKQDKEPRPGAEGDVVDSKNDVRTLDAHYNCFVMGFSYKDVAGDGDTPALKFVVKTPFGQVTEASRPDDPNSNEAKQDYHWIQFKSHGNNNSSETLQLYNKTGLIDLFGLARDVMDRYENDKDIKKNKDKLYYYTVFVDEYYYTKAPKGKENEWGSNPTTYWHHFANQENRYAMLVYAPTYSKDGESSYAEAQYMVSQRSIQTYYSTESEIALGMEHKNESGYGEWENPSSDLDSHNGLWNTWNYIANKQWGTYVNRTKWDQNENTYTTNSKAKVLARCLSRNRDEDGNGYISADEVKWYVPTSEQLMGMYLGAESLPSPLFDANNISFTYEERINYHYPTSDNKRIWSEEGASVGNFDEGWGAGNTPKNFRCVRNLGIDKKKISQDDYPKNAFDYKASGTMIKINNQTISSASNVFSMSRLTEQNIRSSFSSGEISLHNNFENNNKPSKAFQMANDFYKPDRQGGKVVKDKDTDNYISLHTWDVIIRSYWYETINEGTSWYPRYIDYLTTDLDNSLCKNYSEGYNDPGHWRAPNQRELMLMFIQNKDFVRYGGTAGSFSRTEWKYETVKGEIGKRKFAVSPISNGKTNLYLAKADEDGKFYIRCVRDVEIVK